MVRAMITTAHPNHTARLTDASVVTAVVDIAGARHEVLPPRSTCAGALRPVRAAPP